MIQMKFLAFGDTSPNIRLLKKVYDADLSAYDFLIFTGGLATDPEMWKFAQKRALTGPTEKKTEKRTKEELIEIHNKIFEKGLELYKEAVEELGKISRKIKIYGVLGNEDLEAFVSKSNFSKYIEIIHNKSVEINGYYLVGYSGEPIHLMESEHPDEADVAGLPIDMCRWNTHAFGESQIFNDLSKIVSWIDPRKTILVTHCPPYKIMDQVLPQFIKWAKLTYGESGKEGNIGSTGARKITERYEILLHLFGHVHEGKGIKKIGKTTFVNTGSFGREFELAEIKVQNSEVEVNFLRL